MGVAMEPTSSTEEYGQPAIKLPRPVPGGSYAIESMGRWVDRLMGDARARRAATLRLEPLLMDEDEAFPEPEAVEVPAPVPGGTRAITKGYDPPGRHEGS